MDLPNQRHPGREAGHDPDLRRDAVPSRSRSSRPGRASSSQVKTPETDGYDAVQLAFGRGRAVNKPMRATSTTHGGRARRHLVELRIEDAAATGRPGDRGRHLRGRRAGRRRRGLARARASPGVMQRHKFDGQGASHGTDKKHRSPGSIGACATPSRVFKGMRMAGQHGQPAHHHLNLEVVAGRRGAQPAPRQGRGPGPERRPGHGAFGRQGPATAGEGAPDGLDRAPRRGGKKAGSRRPARRRVRHPPSTCR